jgi:hypothetical protein
MNAEVATPIMKIEEVAISTPAMKVEAAKKKTLDEATKVENKCCLPWIAQWQPLEIL